MDTLKFEKLLDKHMTFLADTISGVSQKYLDVHNPPEFDLESEEFDYDIGNGVDWRTAPYIEASPRFNDRFEKCFGIPMTLCYNREFGWFFANGKDAFPLNSNKLPLSVDPEPILDELWRFDEDDLDEIFERAALEDYAGKFLDLEFSDNDGEFCSWELKDDDTTIMAGDANDTLYLEVSKDIGWKLEEILDIERKFNRFCEEVTAELKAKEEEEEEARRRNDDYYSDEYDDFTF